MTDKHDATKKMPEEEVPLQPGRHLYRTGSRGSRVGDSDGAVEMNHVTKSGSNASINTERRSRHASGVSVRSKIVSTAQYHEDLRPQLRQGLTRNLVGTSILLYMSQSFLFGYNIGVLNLPSSFIKSFFNETYSKRNGEPPQSITMLWSLTTTLYVPGGMIGAYAAGFVADKLGRRNAVMFSQIFNFIGAVCSTVCVTAGAPELLMAGRFFTGLNCGFATQLAPMFVAEVAPFNMRGAFGVCHQLFITFGIFVGSVLGISGLLGTEELWPYLLLVNAVPGVICCIAFPFIPDTPRYLMISKKQREAAEKSLKFYRQQDDVQADMEEMETETIETNVSEKKYTMKRFLTTRSLRLPLIIACMLNMIQQLSGINAIFFYSVGIFRMAGFNDDNIQYAVVGTCAINMIMTLPAVPLMDKLGRRPLLIAPMIVMVIDMAVITVALHYQKQLPWLTYVAITCVMVYVICFAVGLGPIPPSIAAELFRQRSRPRAMSMAGLSNWLFTMVVGISFEPIQEAIKEFTFCIFCVFMVGFTVFVYKFVPETKNKTFEEIVSQFSPGGDLEVEEIDDVFPNEVNANNHEVTETKLAEDKQSLTRSVEHIHAEPV